MGQCSGDVGKGIQGAELDSPWVKPSCGEDLAFVFDLGVRRVYDAGAILYHQGDLSHVFYYLDRGRVKVSILREDGSEKVLAIHEPGSLFGESAAFDSRPYFATCTSLEQSVVYVIRVEDVLSLMASDPGVARSIGRSLAQKMRLLTYHVADLTFLDSFSRVAHFLLKLGQDFGISTPAGKRLAVSLTHQDIANLTGTSRVTVTNILNAFKRQGLIQKKHKEIVITDEPRLAEYLSE